MENDDGVREREDSVRRRGAEPGVIGLRVLAEKGVRGEGGFSEAGEATVGCSSASVHWRCRITDLVAHYTSRRSEYGDVDDECTRVLTVI